MLNGRPYYLRLVLDQGYWLAHRYALISRYRIYLSVAVQEDASSPSITIPIKDNQSC